MTGVRLVVTVTIVHFVQERFRPPARYVAPSCLADALTALADPELQPAQVIAGGTDLLVEIDRGAHRDVATLIDISRLEGGDTIDIVDNADGQGAVARLGPTVTHNQVAAHPVLNTRALPLAQACWEVGSPQLRNRATVAGNIATASPANDSISPLLALGAVIELSSTTGLRRVPLVEFITGFRTTVMRDDELISAIEVPLLGTHQRGIYVKLGNRTAQAISVVHAAIVVEFDDDDVTVAAARIALGSVAATVVLATEAADGLVGKPLDATAARTAGAAAAAAVAPIDDVRATAAYRSDTVAVLVQRALDAIGADRQRERWPDAAPQLAAPDAANSVPGASGTLTADSEITTTINGRQHTAARAVGANLLDWLRDEIGITGTKEGCAEGECGACTVVLDGKAVMSCLVPAARAEGATIVTVEGCGTVDNLGPVQQAFVDATAVQCGFCTPGFIVAGTQLLAEHPSPTRQQITQGLAGNLCRCTGYTSIVDAVQRAAEETS